MSSTLSPAALAREAALYALAGRAVAYARAAIPITAVSLWPEPVNGRIGVISTPDSIPIRCQFNIETAEAMSAELPRWMAADRYPTFPDHVMELNGGEWDGVSDAARWAGLQFVLDARDEIVVIAETLLTSRVEALTGARVHALIASVRRRDGSPTPA